MERTQKLEPHISDAFQGPVVVKSTAPLQGIQTPSWMANPRVPLGGTVGRNHTNYIHIVHRATRKIHSHYVVFLYKIFSNNRSLSPLLFLLVLYLTCLTRTQEHRPPLGEPFIVDAALTFSFFVPTSWNLLHDWFQGNAVSPPDNLPFFHLPELPIIAPYAVLDMPDFRTSFESLQLCSNSNLFQPVGKPNK